MKTKSRPSKSKPLMFARLEVCASSDTPEDLLDDDKAILIERTTVRTNPAVGVYLECECLCRKVYLPMSLDNAQGLAAALTYNASSRACLVGHFEDLPEVTLAYVHLSASTASRLAMDPVEAVLQFSAQAPTRTLH